MGDKFVNYANSDYISHPRVRNMHTVAAIKEQIPVLVKLIDYICTWWGGGALYGPNVWILTC